MIVTFKFKFPLFQSSLSFFNATDSIVQVDEIANLERELVCREGPLLDSIGSSSHEDMWM
jgi:hypothetical protein